MRLRPVSLSIRARVNKAYWRQYRKDCSDAPMNWCTQDRDTVEIVLRGRRLLYYRLATNTFMDTLDEVVVENTSEKDNGRDDKKENEATCKGCGAGYARTHHFQRYCKDCKP